MSQNEAISVTNLTQYIREKLEYDNLLSNVLVKGEISNLTRHGSGHVYFTLKDEGAQLSCAMFKSVAMKYYRDLPGHGDKVTLRGAISVYPPRGSYQLIVTAIEKEGLGDLHKRFLELKEKLQREGLFDAAHKKQLPFIPSCVGIVTSPTGAVIRDIINTIRRRFPHVKLLLAPAQVQGSGAAKSIIRAIEKLEKDGQAQAIILARGGGSLEDLWEFNIEELARKIFDCAIPVVAGIGHETDFTIADFVADVRASTPTAAAEMILPDINSVLQYFRDSEKQLRRNLSHYIDYRRQLLDDYSYRLLNSMQSKIDSARSDLKLFEAKIHALDLRRTLERGFTRTEADGKPLKHIQQVKKGMKLTTYFAEGNAESIVEKVNEELNDHGKE